MGWCYAGLFALPLLVGLAWRGRTGLGRALSGRILPLAVGSAALVGSVTLARFLLGGTLMPTAPVWLRREGLGIPDVQGTSPEAFGIPALLVLTAACAAAAALWLALVGRGAVRDRAAPEGVLPPSSPPRLALRSPPCWRPR